MHILLIDDSIEYLDEFVDLLAEGEFADATIDHAVSAVEGSRLMNAGGHDICFVDYRLPGETGLTLIKRVRSAGVNRPIIFLTGFDDPRLDQEAERAGANGFLSKGSFSGQLLCRTIRYAMSNAAERQIPRDAQTRFRLAQETANFGAWDWDIIRNEMTWDERTYHLYGCEPGDGTPQEVWQRTLDADTVRAIEQTRRASVESDEPFQTDYQVTWQDGSVHFIRSAGRVTRDSDGRALRLSGINLDITELQRLVDDLAQARVTAERANEAKSRFLAGITHELRTPLHGILGYAELLSLEGDLNATQIGRLEVMMIAGQYLLGMINSVLDMSQIEADQLDLQPVPFDLTDLISGCLDVVRCAADAKGLALIFKPSTPLRLFADPTRLRQVLINLLGNAVKFTPTGSVEVRHSADRERIRLEVADTGPGIWLKHRDKLFQIFERLNAEAVSGIEGAGLGLAIAARLVKLMGGQVGYLDNPGGGSIFWVELPASCVAANEVHDAAPTLLAETLRRRVLIADDDALNRSIAAGFLNLAGHETVCVDSGAAALEAAAGSDFDVVLMDVRMPGMNGLEATRRIRLLPAPRGEVRVVAVTAQAFAQQIEICQQAGMNFHISKPFTQKTLLAVVGDMPPASSEAGVVSPRPPSSSAELTVFDRDMFEDIAESLPVTELAEHLQTLLVRSRWLLHRLEETGMPAPGDEIGEAAHLLAGGAGTFGFLSVATAARQFEVAAGTGAVETLTLADQLATAIKAAMPIIRHELAATVTVAT